MKTGGKVPTHQTLEEKKSNIYDPFVFNQYNVLYDGEIIYYKPEYKETVELASDFSTFRNQNDIIKPTTRKLSSMVQKASSIVKKASSAVISTVNRAFRTKDNSISEVEISYNKSAFTVEDVLNTLPNEKLIIEIGSSKLDLEYLIDPQLKNTMNRILDTIKENKKFKIITPSYYFPFSIKKDPNTNELYNGLKPSLNIFNKYTFINKFRELLDILLHDYSKEEIKEKIFNIFDIKETSENMKTFINYCDYMDFLDALSTTNNGYFLNIANPHPKEVNPTPSNNNPPPKEEIPIYKSIYDKYNDNKTNAFTQDILSDFNSYINREVDMIITFKTNFLDILDPNKIKMIEIENINTPSLKPQKGKSGKKVKTILTKEEELLNSKSKQMQEKLSLLQEEVGMDLKKYVLLFYIRERLDNPFFNIANRRATLFPISKHKFIQNLMNDPTLKIIPNDSKDISNLYPKNTSYRTTVYKNIIFPACAERGLFEYIKFICFHNEKKSFIAQPTMKEPLKTFINTNSEKIWKNSDDEKLFNEFVTIITDYFNLPENKRDGMFNNIETENEHHDIEPNYFKQIITLLGVRDNPDVKRKGKRKVITLH